MRREMNKLGVLSALGSHIISTRDQLLVNTISAVLKHSLRYFGTSKRVLRRIFSLDVTIGASMNCGFRALSAAAITKTMLENSRAVNVSTIATFTYNISSHPEDKILP